MNHIYTTEIVDVDAVALGIVKVFPTLRLNRCVFAGTVTERIAAGNFT